MEKASAVKKSAAKASSKEESKKESKKAAAAEAKSKEPFVLKPKKPTSAWIYFNTETVAKLKAEGMDQKEAFGKSAEIWKTLSENQKKPYSDKAKQDESRYQAQLKELETKGFFMTADGQKSTDLFVDPKKKYGSSCMLPKKPLSAYLFYTTENVNKIKEKDGCSHPEAMKKCGEIWNSLSDAEKQKYYDMHSKDVVRYDS